MIVRHVSIINFAKYWLTLSSLRREDADPWVASIRAIYSDSVLKSATGNCFL